MFVDPLRGTYFGAFEKCFFLFHKSLVKHLKNTCQNFQSEIRNYFDILRTQSNALPPFRFRNFKRVFLETRFFQFAYIKSKKIIDGSLSKFVYVYFM